MDKKTTDKLYKLFGIEPDDTHEEEPSVCAHGCGKAFSGTSLEYAIHRKLAHTTTNRRGYKSKYTFRALKNGRARCNTCMTVIKGEGLSQHYHHMHPEIVVWIPRKRPGLETAYSRLMDQRIRKLLKR